MAYESSQPKGASSTCLPVSYSSPAEFNFRMRPPCAGIRDSRLPPICGRSFLQGSRQSDKNQRFSTKLLCLNFKRLLGTYVKMSVLSIRVRRDNTNNLKHTYTLILGLKKTAHFLFLNLKKDIGGRKCARSHLHTLHSGVTQFVKPLEFTFKNYLTLNIKIFHLGVIIIP